MSKRAGDAPPAQGRRLRQRYCEKRANSAAKNVIIVMGVSGVGKSRLAAHLAQTFTAPFFEGDAYHPPANIEKMRQRIPLSDQDRQPWIKALTKAVTSCPDDLVFVSCSSLTALVQSWLKDQLKGAAAFLYLEAPPDVIKARLETRAGHFMTADLLQSQLEALTIPETALTVDASQPFEDVCTQAVQMVTHTIAQTR